METTVTTAQAQGARTEKKVQITMSVLKELVNNKKLADKFIDIVGEEEMKASMAIAIARREIK